MTVLLVGARTATALVLARSLARAGAEVVAADCYAGSLVARSRSVRTWARLPSPRFEREAFEDTVRGLIRDHRVDHVVPGGEEAFGVARMADPGVPVWAGPLDRLVELHDKARFVARVEQLRIPGVRAPETWPADEIRHHRDRDLVVKPRDSRFGQGVRLVPRGSPTPGVGPGDLVQERIEGDEVCSLSWAVEGRVVTHVGYRPMLRFPHGPAFLVERADPPGLRALAEALVDGTGWNGPIAFDAFVRPDGTVVPIECNPRITAGAWFLPDLGRLIVDGTPAEPRGDRAMVGMGAVTAGLRSAPSLAAWWRLIRSARDVLWDRADPWPFWTQLHTTPGLWALARRHGISMQEATTWLTRP